MKFCPPAPALAMISPFLSIWVCRIWPTMGMGLARPLISILPESIFVSKVMMLVFGSTSTTFWVMNISLSMTVCWV